jgi:hypothetical protein
VPPAPTAHTTSPAPPSLDLRKTARFKTAATAAPSIAPSPDGKLPALQLAEGEAAKASGETGEKTVPLWLACVAVVGSTLLSAFLLLSDTPGQKSVQSKQAEARQQIAAFYGSASLPLRPFQVLLREAQQAHSRGDRSTERQKYRQVHALLRAEKRSKYENLTGTPSDDEQLAELLSILLAND